MSDRRPVMRHPRPPAESIREDEESGFRVKLRNFEGPFDLLLNLSRSIVSTSPRWRCTW